MDEQSAADSGKRSDPARWVALHGEAMFAYARLRLGDSDAAEEAVQEALLAAYRSKDRFDERSSERTWLIGVLRHKVLDRIRKDQREAEVSEDLRWFKRGHWAQRQKKWPGTLEDAEIRGTVIKAMEALPDQMRRALVLREIDQIPSETVCEILGVSRTNLWTLIHRGKLRLRRAVTEILGGGAR